MRKLRPYEAELSWHWMNIYFLDTRDGNLISSRLVIKSVDNHTNQGGILLQYVYCIELVPDFTSSQGNISFTIMETLTCIGGISYKFNSPLFVLLFHLAFFFFYSLLCHFFVLHVPINLHICRTIKFQRPSILLLSEFNRRLMFVFIRYPICPSGLLH